MLFLKFPGYWSERTNTVKCRDYTEMFPRLNTNPRGRWVISYEL
jgi:hypothetical protein